MQPLSSHRKLVAMSLVLLAVVACNRENSRPPQISKAKPNGQNEREREPTQSNEKVQPVEATETPSAPDESQDLEPVPSDSSTESATAHAASTLGAEVDPMADETLSIPKVEMTAAHLATGIVNVGDPMPDFRLPALDGTEHPLAELLGKKLTVVVFWTASQPYATEQIHDLGPLVAERFSDRGVNVVAINEGDTLERAREAAGKSAPEVVLLRDPTGKALAQVATGKLPRTYLLDAEGKVLWLDIEYSRSTRRDLVRAIRAALAEK